MDRSLYLDRSPGQGRKLQKRRLQPQRQPSITYPDRLKPGPDKDDDVASAHGVQAHMNQSMFSLIAAAGSKTDLYPRFGDESSGSDTEQEEEGQKAGKKGEDSNIKQKIRQDRVDLGSGTAAGLEDLDMQTKDGKKKESKPGRRNSKLLQSLPRLRVKSHREKNYMSQSMILPGRTSGAVTPSPGPITPRDAPVMRKIIEAESKAEPDHAQIQEPQNLTDPEGRRSLDSRPKLMSKLKEIFGFDELEEVISEYPCWLLQSVLLQGYLYITAKHFCFYAYLPKKSNTELKRGSLMKKVKRGPKYNRQWFVLKGDILSYYDSPSSLYFQVGHVDLRFATSASLTESKDDSKETKDFTVATPNRTYYFRADSTTSAKEWVKMLQKVIFRTHNDGDSVKIALPIANVIDIEESPVIEVAKTVKIQVIESEETLAVDEYYFSFFSFGQDAMSVMQSMVVDTPGKRLSTDLLISRKSGEELSKAKRASHLRIVSDDIGINDAVRATLSPVSPPVTGRASPRPSQGGDSRSASLDIRRSTELSQNQRRASSEARRSFDGGKGRRNTDQSPSSAAKRRPRDSYAEISPIWKASEPSESFVDSIAASSGPDLSTDDFHSSGSQVLSRSDIFKAKGRRFPESPEESDDEGRKEEEQQDEDEEDDRNDNEEDESHTKTKASAKQNYGARESRSATPRLTDYSEQRYISSPIDVDASSPGLKKLIKAGQYPLQRAAGIAGMLHRGSKDMSALLATKSMDYVEKVSGMWSGGGRHYKPSLDGLDDVNEDDIAAQARDHHEASARFRSHFGLPDSERLLAAYFGFLHRVLPLYGKIYVSDKYFCFRSLLPGTNTKIILPLRDVETVHKEKGFRLRYSGLVVVIQGFEELFFEFSQREVRDDCAVFLLRCLDSTKVLSDSMHSSTEEDDARLAKAEHRALMEARRDGQNVHEIELPKMEDSINAGDAPTVNFDDPRASILNFKPTESLRITCLTIGSRGDVQPYIALCKGLLAEGHKPTIASHAEFGPWVRSHGIGFEPIDGDPAELMRICIENGMFTVSFLREASAKFRGWLDDLLASAWKACQGSDLLIESPSAMAGVHIAEALKIPYFRAFTMPWTRTRAYPHAFAVPEHRMGGAYNWLTYVMFDNVFWAAISGQVNRWRKKDLKLPSTTLEKLHQNKVPFLYNFSPSVVIPPIDFSDWVRVTGYWFLDEGKEYVPDESLIKFIRQSREDGKKLVYIGFGSIVVSNPRALTQSIVEAVVKADVRCILSKGWSDRLGQDSTKTEVPLPPEILQIKACPHDWLFKQVDCAVHHGGAGTTGASLRAGLPTIVKPFFGDQFFFGNRIEDLQVGIYLKKLNVSVLSRALWEATHSERMITKARLLGEQIRKEDGVGSAIQAIYRDMEYAKSLIKNRDTAASGGDDNEAGDEESWTFIGDEGDPDLNRRIAAWDGFRRKTEVEMGQSDTSDHVDGLEEKQDDDKEDGRKQLDTIHGMNDQRDRFIAGEQSAARKQGQERAGVGAVGRRSKA